MAKIAIVSDIHLGTRQYGLKERYEDFHSSFEEFGKSLRGYRLDAVVIGGDLFDSPRPDANSVLVAQDVVKVIRECGPVYGIDGNHDLSNGDWLRVIGVEPLGDGQVAKVGDLKMCGLHYRNGRDFIAAIRDMVDRGVKADILVAHFALAEMGGGGTSDTGVQEICPLLEKIGVKCVLMGHIHIPEARMWNGILFVNPGSTEMKSSNEPRDKYYFVVDTDTWSATEVPIMTRPIADDEITNEADVEKFREDLTYEMDMEDKLEIRPFHQVIADDSIEDVYKRVAQIVHDTGAIARIVTRSSKARDLAPVVDRKESVASLESAVEARFPKESDEAKLTVSYLHSSDPASVHLITEKYLKGEK